MTPSERAERRKIRNTVARWFRNRGSWPSVERVAAEHTHLSPERVRELVAAQPEFEIVNGTVRLVGEEQAVSSSAPAPVEDWSEDRPVQDGTPIHLALTYAMQRAARELPVGRAVALQLPSFPRAVLGGRSRNMALMTLYLVIAEARRREDRATIDQAVRELERFVAQERDVGLQSQEILSQYATWSIEALGLIWRDLHRLDAQQPVLGLLADHLRREVALWRVCALRITVRNRPGARPRYVGLGCRTAGTRKLPSSIVDLSNGVFDSVMSLLIDRPPEIDRWRGKSRSLDDRRGVEAELVTELEELRGLCRDVATVEQAAALLERQHVRTLVPLVVERFRDGSIGTYLLENASLQTGAVWAVLQNADGVGYEALFPYRDADGKTSQRVRKGHPQLGRGRARLEQRELKVWSADPEAETSLQAARASLQLPPASERGLMVRLHPQEGTTVLRGRARPIAR